MHLTGLEIRHQRQKELRAPLMLLIMQLQLNLHHFKQFNIQLPVYVLRPCFLCAHAIDIVIISEMMAMYQAYSGCNHTI